MPLPRLPRLSLRRMCLCTLVTTFAVLTAIILATFYIALPMRRAYYLELGYQEALRANSKLQSPPIIVRPLVDGATQLFTWPTTDHDFQAWNDVLGLNLDGTASDFSAGSEAWIYLAGTAHDSRQRPGSYSHKWKLPDCDDPADMCDEYIDAFQRMSKRWHRRGLDLDLDIMGKSLAFLRWVDCDVSPILCSTTWGGAGVNLLLHMKVDHNCDYSMIPVGSCGVTWRWIGLPLRTLPWTRQIRIPLDGGGSTVVPAFPSADEQLETLMIQHGALEALEYSRDDKTASSTWNSIAKVIPQNGKPPEYDNGPTPFCFWGLFRFHMDNPWDTPQWPYETEVKCYIERYADVLLGWWDDAAHLVQPRSCVDVAKKAEEAKQQRRDEDAYWEDWVAKKQEEHEEKMAQYIQEALTAAIEHNARAKKSDEE